MKKLLLSFVALTLALTASAQGVEIYKNGKLVSSYKNSSTDLYKAVFTASPAENPSEVTNTASDGREYVNLNLPSGTQWATCNVGAESPTEAGDYFAWGETTGYNIVPNAYPTANSGDWTYSSTSTSNQNPGYSNLVTNSTPKTTYDWSTYKWGKASDDGKTIYLYKNKNANKATLLVADDAAYQNWNSSWKTPTDADWLELLRNCYIAYTSSYNGSGVKGYIVYKAKNDADKGLLHVSSSWKRIGEADTVYSNASGSTTVATYTTADTHIFLPVTGYYTGTTLTSNTTCGCYWSSSLNAYAISRAFSYYFTSATMTRVVANTNINYNRRCSGLCVRPIYRTTSTPDYVDLGLSVKWAKKNVEAESETAAGSYFAWGETRAYNTTPNAYPTSTSGDWTKTKNTGYSTSAVKTSYSWTTYKWGSGTSADKTYKYRSDDYATLSSVDDAATAKLGNDWRTPTQDEWLELMRGCYIEYSSDYNGAAGYIVYKVKNDADKGLIHTSSAWRQIASDGTSYSTTSVTATTATYTTADTHIFLPVTGYYSGTSLTSSSYGYYWTSSLNTTNVYNADYIYFGSASFYNYSTGVRYYGRPIRAVHK